MMKLKDRQAIKINKNNSFFFFYKIFISNF